MQAFSDPVRSFGAFEVDLRAHELRKRGLKIRLQDQPFQILAMLLERPGAVVTREELRQKLWSSETFVDFDHGLNNAINRLREALSDSAENPRFIETLPRRGYRFLAPVKAAGPAHSPEPSFAEQGAPAVELVQPPVVHPDAIDSRPGNNADVSPDALLGEQKTDVDSVPANRSRLRFPSRQITLAGLSLALILIAGAWFTWHRRNVQREIGSAAGIQSLAVLPLKNVSEETGQEYFAEGMTDELITELAKISALRVISRTSVMQYRGEEKTVPEIARELNVDAVVEGTLLRAGDRVRITAQLIRAVPEKHLWSESYERDLRNILDLQREVARAIANEIKIKLTSRERAGLSTTRPVDPAAHEDYLRGLHFWNKRTEQDLQKSIEYFDRAIQKDPGYALGYAGLANAYNCLGVYAHLIPRQVFPKARAAALKALTLDDTLAEAHAALCFYNSNYGWDQPAADRECRRAIDLNPGYTSAHVWRGEALSAVRRHREALAELDRARELDPTSLMVSDQRGWVLYMARRYDDAIEQIRKTLELEQRLAHAHCWLGKAYLQKGMLQQGLSEIQQAASLPGGDSPLFAPWLGYAYALAGKRAEAFQVIEQMKAQQQKNFGSPFGIAAIYCGLGEKQQALAWLEKACQERDPQFSEMAIDPAMDPLRSDPHFRELLRQSTMPP